MSKREYIRMDQKWSFHEGDIKDDVVHGYMYTYMQTKAERGRGPASIDYDHSNWELVDLPHDFVVRGTPDPRENHVHGSLKRNNAWYRRFFRLEPEDRDRKIRLIFDGVGTVCKIWVNGCLVKYNDSAYTGFEIDISDIARYGDDLNLIAVYIDNTEFEAWWYEGAGIYRHVYLEKTDRVAVQDYGVYVNPQKIDEHTWKMDVETTIHNDTDELAELDLVTKLDRLEAFTVEKIQIEAREEKMIITSLVVYDPPIWSTEHPELCQIRTELYRDGLCIDEIDTTFGFRTIRFDAEKGFFLNDVPTKIKGMCIHEDHGGLGSGVMDAVKEYRVQCLKDMGCNGYRFSHNPHSKETLDACDRLGMLVMDENRWFESSEQGLRRVEWMVKRDRNHPSVVLWSMGNEESLQNDERGRKIMSRMKASVKKLDRTRPVLMAMHTGLLEPGAATVADVIGMNYNIELCDQIHDLYPDKPIIFSEASNVSEDDVLGNRQAGIDTWKIVATKKYMCGLFAWSGMDYRGEHAYPELFAPAGVMDQNGYAKDSYYLYKSYWTDKPMLYIQPHWNQPSKLNEEVTVRIFTTGDYVQLYLNGQLIGEQSVDPFEMSNFKVSYEPGELKAVAWRNGLPEAEAVRITTGKAVRMLLDCENDRKNILSADAVIITVTAADEQGRRVPDASGAFTCDVEGGCLLVTGNGNIADQSDRRQPVCSLYRGIAQIICRPNPASRHMVIKVMSEELGTAQISVKIRDDYCSPQECAYEESPYLNHWEVSEWMQERPDIQNPDFSQYGPFHPVEIGHGTNMHDLSKDSGYFVYHTQVCVPKFAAGKKTAVHFELLEGQSWIYVITDHDYAHMEKGHKTGEDPQEYRMDLKEKAEGQCVDIWVILHVWMPFCGITKPVRWEGEF